MTTVRRCRLLFALATLTALGGCAAIRRNDAAFTGDFLVAAGFKVEPADTPERRQQLRAMPPLEMVSQAANGQLVYRYADPYRCQCEYVGDPEAYREYRRLVHEDYLDTLLSLPLL